ncbi:MAG TPA: hypothetical protein VKD90_21700 [Gemmataceae bacterium]|nr:hypothetical protein [Gemmataceae bacterium]
MVDDWTIPRCCRGEFLFIDQFGALLPATPADAWSRGWRQLGETAAEYAAKRAAGVGFFMLADSGKALPHPDIPEFRIVLDLATLQYTLPVPVWFRHRAADPVGEAWSIEIGRGGLYAEGAVDRRLPFGRLVYELARERFVWAASVGVRCGRGRLYAHKDNRFELNGRQFENPVDRPVFVAKGWTLTELSFCQRGHDPETIVKVDA